MAAIVVILLLVPGLGFLFFVVSMLLFHQPQIYKEHRIGICDGCGYDLTGNRSGKCPECGMRVPPIEPAPRS